MQSSSLAHQPIAAIPRSGRQLLPAASAGRSSAACRAAAKDVPELQPRPVRPQQAAATAPKAQDEEDSSDGAPEVLAMLDDVAENLASLQGRQAEAHCRLQASHAELQASMAEIRTAAAQLSAGVDQVGRELGRLRCVASPRSRTAAAHSRYSAKLGRLLVRELLLRRQ